MLKVNTPISTFSDKNGLPLQNGYIYVGTVGKNPELNPVNLFWDFAGTKPVSQPVRTINGFPSYNGKAGTLFVNSDYSIVVRNNKKELLVYSLNSTDLTAISVNELVVDGNIDMNSYKLLELGNGVLINDAVNVGQVQKNQFNSAIATGTVDILIGEFSPDIDSISNGQTFFVLSSGFNISTTPTFTPNSGVIAPANIIKGNNLPLVAGDITGWVELKWNSLLSKWEQRNPASGITLLPSSETVSGTIKIGTAAEATACISDTVALTPKKLMNSLNASGLPPIYACRAWATWDGTGTVPAAPKGGGNVSSITDLGIGSYRVNFAVNMPDVNYAVLVTCNGVAVNALYDNKLVSSVGVLIKNSSNVAATDIDDISCMIMR